MVSRSRNTWTAGLLTAVFAFGGVAALNAQTQAPSSRMFGTGYIDVPIASAPRHMTIVGTFSGMNIGDWDNQDPWKTDGSIFLGLFDRLELGVTLQSIAGSDEGGNMIGGFGKLALIRPQDAGLGLAVGASYVSSPSFDNISTSRDYQPNRLGYPDPIFYDGVNGGADVSTTFSPYVVATVTTEGWRAAFLPQNDFTVSLGYGGGIWNEDVNDDPYFTPSGDTEGFFAGIGAHLAVGDNSLLHILGDWNGFDGNLGAQLDWGGIRLGGFIHHLFDEVSSSPYGDRKYGFLASVAFCPGDGLCPPFLFERPQPERIVERVTVRDTVVVERRVEDPLPTGTATTLCLATGQEITVYVTPQGDTLVGPRRVSIRELRPGIVFAGDYAEGRPWYENEEDIVFERRRYSQSGNPTRMDCPDLMRVGEYMGVPLFARRNATRPYETLYVPVRPGWWQAYQMGQRQTVG